ncbi:type III secretion system stator protein SctL [Butyrivibrio fibrisolvens]|uniref:type III secretion system stator protein SctL n=1 Tax=Butyrivibrio fibrisolvens TaxID=831 RepID=UPI0004296776|nr:type III secretion system stator protein SctL [Butyrivibrio fibrisolvens]
MSNLVKGMWVTLDSEDTRIIDNNELSDIKIQESYEEEMRRRARQNAQMQAEEGMDGMDDMYEPSFNEGLSAEPIDRLMEDQEGMDGMDAMPSEMSLSDFDGESGMMPDSPNQMPGDEYGGQDPSYGGGYGGSGDMPPNIQKDIDQILNDAQVQANQIVADARAQADQILSQAREEGHRQGYDEGFQEGMSKSEDKIEKTLQKKEKELEARYERMTQSVEPEMVDTLTRIYEHVFNVSFKDDKEIILHLLQTALSRIESSGSLLIHISPDDYDMITDAKEQLMQNVVSPDTVLELVEDPTLKENECIIETDGGIFDCSVGVELEELGRKIKLLSFDRRN